MDLRPSARALVRLGVLLLLAGALASGWELLAMQAPSSPWHVGVLPGPVGRLRDTAVTLGLVMFAAAWLVPAFAREKEPWALVGAVHLGTVLTLGGLAWGATTGMYGVQIDDARPLSRWIFDVRATGELVLFVCLVELARRLLFARARRG